MTEQVPGPGRKGVLDALKDLRRDMGGRGRFERGAELPPEYRGARESILHTRGHSPDDVRAGKFDHEIHKTLVHEIASKYNVSEARASAHAHHLYLRVFSRCRHTFLNISAKILGPAAATITGVLAPKYVTSFLALAPGTFAASLTGLIPLILIGGAIYAGHRAAAWTGEPLEASSVIRKIWHNEESRQQLREAVAGGQNLTQLCEELYLKNRRSPAAKHLATAALSATGIAIGTMGAGAISAFADPGLMGRLLAENILSRESPWTFLPKAFFKEGFGLLSAPLVNLWKFVAGMRTL